MTKKLEKKTKIKIFKRYVTTYHTYLKNEKIL